MKTGKDVQSLGLYIDGCCNEELILDAGENFPRCPKCQQLTKWEFVEIVWDLQSLDDIEVQAA
jgi:hypothetical protein